MRIVALLGFVSTGVASAVTYQLDDGTGESGLGGFGSETIFLNSFTSAAGGEYINQISIAFGSNIGGGMPSDYNGRPIMLHVWSDPNDDGVPDDAVLETSQADVISNFTATDGAATATVFVDFPLLSSVYIPAGERFFVGVQTYDAASVYAPARDETSSQNNSWIYRWFGATPGAAGMMSAAPSKQNYNDTFGGNALIRATGAAIPEPGLLGLFALGGFALGLRRRR